MNKNSDFIKGMGAGLISGMLAATVIKSSFKGDKKSIAKTCGKTMRAVGNIAESLNYMLR